MLRLTGEKADGWLPSLPYLKPGDLERGNAIIDQAAAGAGRDPREIRRLLNITPEAASVEALLPFALRDGVSVFILASDDPRAIQAWGQEVAPALREAVARERQAAGTPSGEVARGPKALALRRDGSSGATLLTAIRAVGGAVNDVDPHATAYPHRHQNFNVSSVGGNAERFHRHWDELRRYLDGLYLSFETDQRPQRLHDAFPGETLTRLRELKATYDPENVFDQNFPITPLRTAAVHG